MNTNIKTISSYVVAFAGAAASAQKIMTSASDPMVIKEFKFSFHLASDILSHDNQDLVVHDSRIPIHQKLNQDYKEHMGISISCTLVPLNQLNAIDQSSNNNNNNNGPYNDNNGSYNDNSSSYNDNSGSYNNNNNTSGMGQL